VEARTSGLVDDALKQGMGSAGCKVTQVACFLGFAMSLWFPPQCYRRTMLQKAHQGLPGFSGELSGRVCRKVI